MSKRIYKVTDSEFNSTRLIRANSPSQALGHVAKSRFTVNVASQEELLQVAVDEGVMVETAGAELPPLGDPTSEPAGDPPAPPSTPESINPSGAEPSGDQGGGEPSSEQSGVAAAA